MCGRGGWTVRVPLMGIRSAVLVRSIDDRSGAFAPSGVADLQALGCRFALVGGLAVSARAEPRLTRDADLVVSVVGDAEAEELLARLRVDGYTVQTLVEQTATGRLATARLVRAGESLVTDLLFASSGIESEIVDEADELLVVPDLVVPTASIGHLVALKLLARDDRSRPADADDLASLAQVAGEDDWESARRAAIIGT